MSGRSGQLARTWLASEAPLSPADFDRYVNAPMTADEVGEARALMAWFQRRYPTPLERLEYATRAWATAHKLAEPPFPAGPFPAADPAGPHRFLPSIAASSADWALDLDVVEWFLWHRGRPGTPVDERPIGRWLRNLRRYARARARGPEGIAELEAPAGPAEQRHLSAITDIYGARLLSWSIRVLETHRDPVAIDASFVTEELCGADTTEPGGPLLMPRGVGTLYLAARCARAAGGAIRVHGSTPKRRGGKRLDVEWSPAAGEVIAFERKDRAFFRAAEESGARLARTLGSHLLETPAQLSTAPSGALRVASVGAVTRSDEIDAALEALNEMVPSIAKELRSQPLASRPDALVVMLFAYGVRDAQIEARFEPRCFAIGDDRPSPTWDALHAAFDGPRSPRR